MNTQPSVCLETDGPVSTIILSRPKQRNAVDRTCATALREAFERFEQDDSQRVAVLWGAHGTFCAGADLAAVGDPARRSELDPEGSAYAQWNLPLAEALRQEGRLGMPIVEAEGADGAARFVAGAGRHGRF